MTIDDLEANYTTPRTRLSQEVSGNGIDSYELCVGREIIAIGMGLCPKCGDGVELNKELSDYDRDFYDCVAQRHHRWVVFAEDRE